ncbi:MAG: hypothetical protein U5K73_02465 [Halofilum sp. (in: g-proteobacteria)]|nr:hypothetical protein [Halofilum sp. (in: g-proteobacteria)]
MTTRLRHEWTFLATATLVALAVAALSSHRAGLYALPGDRIVVWFGAETERALALRQIGSAGAVLSRIGPLPGMYRVDVLDPAAPRRLAEHALVLRDPVDGFAQCFGVDLSQAAATRS